jgi:hypothetical protein
MADRAPWTCPTCKTGVPTPFCPRCGEEPLKPTDLTLRGIAARLWHAFTSIDARVLRSARRLIQRPGELALAWNRGAGHADGRQRAQRREPRGLRALPLRGHRTGLWGEGGGARAMQAVVLALAVGAIVLG